MQRTGIAKADIVIVGGGPVGLSLACALADGLGTDARIVLVEPQHHAGATHNLDDDPRALAISSASRQLLACIGAWDTVAPYAQPITAIEITDSSLKDAFRPKLVGYDNHMPDGTPATYVLGDLRLRTALRDAVGRRASIALIDGATFTGLATDDAQVTVALSRGETLQAPLVIAADGSRSSLRDRAGIKVVRWDYGQIGIVTTVRLAAPHEGRAVQHFLPAGPFAILPLRGERACITWSEEAARGAAIMALDAAGFKAELELRFAARLGDFEVVGKRLSWPLHMHLARSFVANRVALAGDAAHGVHPLAGQGLNLGLRDVAALAEVITDAARLGLDIGAATTLERYERWRRTDSAMSAFTYDALNRLFSNDVTMLRTARDFGLGLVDRMPGLKQLFVSEAAGLTGEVPKLLRGEPV